MSIASFGKAMLVEFVLITAFYRYSVATFAAGKGCTLQLAGLAFGACVAHIPKTGGCRCMATRDGTWPSEPA